jgi:hypothetical protein
VAAPFNSGTQFGDVMEKALESWHALNACLRTCTEAAALRLLEAEKKGAKRLIFLIRCHATYNKLRGRRETLELQQMGVRCR